MGEFDVDLTHEFFQGFVNHALATVHIDNLRGDNAHHQCETVFKAFARALRMAVEPDPRAAGVDSLHQGSPLAPTAAARRAMAQRIAIVDYGMGNLRSVQKALAHVAPGADVEITADPARDPRAPTASSSRARARCPTACARSRESGLGEAVARGRARASPSSACASASRCSSSAAPRATRRASALLAGRVRRLRSRPSARRRAQGAAHGLERGAGRRRRTRCGRASPTAAASISCTATTASRPSAALAAGETRYPDAFTSAIARDNIFATQFHPEKSAVAGLTLLSNFASWNP